MKTTNSKLRRGRPPLDPQQCIRRGILIRPRLPRWLHSEVKQAAFDDELAMTAWVRIACEQAIERRKKAAA